MEKTPYKKKDDTQEVDVIIAIPGHSLMSPTIKSLLELTMTLNRKGISWLFTNAYASHVTNAREVTLSGTFINDIRDNKPLQGKVKYKKILWIDSDIAFTPDDALTLIDSDKDIVTGAYLLASGETAIHPKALSKPYHIDEIMDITEPTKIWGAGFGFICIKYGVFESLSRPWFQSVEMTRTFDDGSEYKFNLIGEDLSFCERAQQAGFEVWFDPSVKVNHHKMMQLTWEGIVPL